MGQPFRAMRRSVLAFAAVAFTALAVAPIAAQTPPPFRFVWYETGNPSNLSWSPSYVNGSVDIPDYIKATETQLPNGEWQLEVTNLRPGYTLQQVYFPLYEAGGVTHCPSCPAEPPWPPGCPCWPTCPEYGGCANTQFRLGTEASDDVLIYPRWLGTAAKVTSQPPSAWMWGTYPGASDAFAPFMIRTDANQAELLAATNWDAASGIEPRPVRPIWACNGWGLWYFDLAHPPVAPGAPAQDRFRMTLWSSDGTPIGAEPWVDVADEYASWLQSRMQTAGLGPVDYPSWIDSIHGFMPVGLQNSLDHRVEADVQAIWNNYKTTFPWIQFWGQMSDYGGECCGQCRLLDPRYDSQTCPNPNPNGSGIDVRCFAAGVRAEGRHVGFYTAPFNNWLSGMRPMLDDAATCITPADYMNASCPVNPQCDSNGDQIPDGESALDWFVRWNALAETDWGANAFYYDTLGSVAWGEPLFVAGLFGNTLSNHSVSEFPVDVYPTAFLGSGLFLGDSPNYYPGGPGSSTLEDLAGSTCQIKFTPLASLVLADRYFFSGAVNDGYKGWGLCRGYWMERQAFLLGHKFDAAWPHEKMGRCGVTGAACPEPPWAACDAARAAEYCEGGDWANIPGSVDVAYECMDEALALAVQERDAHAWWGGRRPRYRHRIGLTAVPAGTDIRRFDDASGTPLLAIDNWNGASGTFRFNGIELPLPSQKLAIYEGVDLADTDGDLIGDSIDPDDDNDGVLDASDNCPGIANANQWDCDDDGTGDVCSDYCVAEFYSTSASDGWASRNSSNVFAANPGVSLITGDAKVSNKQTGYRGVASFPTSTLGPQALVLDATLYVTPALVKGTVGGSSGFTTITVSVREGSFGPAGIDAGDYNAAAEGSLSTALPFPTTSSDTETRSVPFLGNERDWINGSGVTEVRLQFNTEWDGDGTTDQVLWSAGEWGAPLAPRLWVRYTAP